MNIEDLYANVLPSVRGCPHITALDALQAAAVEFCRRTLVWRKTLPAVASVLAPLTFTGPLVAAYGATLTATFTGTTRTDYLLTFSDGTYQVVTLNNGSTTVTWANPVTATASATYSQVTYAIPAPTDAAVSKLLGFTVGGIKRRVVSPDFGEDLTDFRFSEDAAWTVDRINFNVSPPPAAAGIQYGLKVALQPTSNAMTLPDEIGNTYGEELTYGALYRLQRMNDRQWSNDQDALRNRQDFDLRIGIVSKQAAKGFGRGRLRVKAHFF